MFTIPFRPKLTTTAALDAIEARITAVPAHLAAIFTVTTELQNIVTTREGNLIQAALGQPLSPLNAGTAHGTAHNLALNQHAETATMRTNLDTLLRSERFKEAAAIIAPLLAERDKALAAVEAERMTITEKTRALQAAQAVAHAKAQAAADADPALVAARKALEQHRAA